MRRRAFLCPAPPTRNKKGTAPLVFGQQYGELSSSFESPIDTLAVKGCDQAADHYLLDVGPGAASVQKRLVSDSE